MHGWVKLELDVRALDAARFTQYAERCQAAGIRLVTLAGLGDTPAHRRALYELNKECSADIPERGEFYTFEEYLARRIDAPSFDPVVSSSPWTATRGAAWPSHLIIVRRVRSQRDDRSDGCLPA